MLIRAILFLLVIFHSQLIIAQTASIDKDVKRIDSLFKAKALVEKSYPNKSYCGGALKGYYYNGTLLYINGLDGGDEGYNEIKYYLKGDSAIMMQENAVRLLPGELDAYIKKRGGKTDNMDLSGLRSDTEKTVIYFTSAPVVRRWMNKKKVQLNKDDQLSEIKNARECFRITVTELNEIEN